MINTYGYSDGLLSNSMLQAAIVCPLKYKLSYLDRKRPYDGKLFDATSIGTVVHKALELAENDPTEALRVFWEQIISLVGEELAGDAKSLMRLVISAREDVAKDGEKWGRVYKAPEMTSFWKKKYSGLDRLLANLDARVEAKVKDSVWDLPFSQLVLRGLVSLANWPNMRIGEQLGAEVVLSGLLGPEDSQQMVVGTIDRLEQREGGVAICDYKTGAFAYTADKVVNSDQFGTYHRLVEQEMNLKVVEWVLYDLFSNNTIRIEPTSKMLDAFDARFSNNIRYFKQVEAMFGKVEVPVPAGSSYKTGCPCVFARTGDCNFYIS